MGTAFRLILALGALVLSTAAPATGAQTVVGFALVNAETGAVIAGYEQIADGATINLRSLPTRDLNIVATTSPSVVGSVVFGYDADPSFRIENSVPYALAGNDGSRFSSWTPALGSHTVSATPYSAANGSGTRGTTLARTIHVIDQAGPSVRSFTLINADTGQPVPGHDPLPSTIDLAALPTRRLNVRANTEPATVGSVRFGYDGDASYRIENWAPYALAGNAGDGYLAWTPTVGAHTVTATPFSASNAGGTAGPSLVQPFVVVDGGGTAPPSDPPTGQGRTMVSIAGNRFFLNGAVTYRGTVAEGRLMNTRMVNAVFEDANRPEFDADANTDEFLAVLPQYVQAGVRAFTISLQGGNPSYEGAVNTAFTSSGALRSTYMARVQRVIESADAHGAVIILSLFYQRQDQYLANETAVRNAVVNTVRWIVAHGFTNVLVEVANEYGHSGFDHDILASPAGVASLMELARQTAPQLYVSSSGYGDGLLSSTVASASDFLLIHTGSVAVYDYDDRIGRLRGYGKPILINEDPKTGLSGTVALETALAQGASWGLHLRANQAYPFTFRGTADDSVVYSLLRIVTGTAPRRSRRRRAAPAVANAMGPEPNRLDD